MNDNTRLPKVHPVKSGWNLPPKPEGDYCPAVYFDGEECYIHWYSETEQIDCIEMVGKESWPFTTDFATPDDFRKLGFIII